MTTKILSITCSVEACERKRHPSGSQYCSMHMERKRLRGDPGAAAPEKRDNGTGNINMGYKVLTRPGHPLGDKRGRVPEHRVALYEAIGPGLHNCHWCDRIISWDRRWPTHQDALTVDHLTADKLNNSPDNLVPACGMCNSKRGGEVTGSAGKW